MFNDVEQEYSVIARPLRGWKIPGLNSDTNIVPDRKKRRYFCGFDAGAINSFGSQVFDGNALSASYIQN